VAVKKAVKSRLAKKRAKPKKKARPAKKRAKPRARTVKKKTAAKKSRRKSASPKKVSKAIKSLRKGLKKEIALTRKVSKNTSKHGKGLELLRKEVEKLKKRRKKAGLSEYNRFMRQQIKKGLSFKQAAKLWSKRKRELAKKSKKRTAYNIFVSMQLKQGKTMKQAIAAWNKLKKSPVKRRRKPTKKKAKPRKRVVKKKRKSVKRKRKSVKRKRKPVKRKAKPRTVTRVRRVEVEKPVVVTRDIFPADKVSRVVDLAVSRARAGEELKLNVLKEVVSSNAASGKLQGEVLCDEEIALKMLDVYFTEVARHGLKRTLTLDEVINSYFYSLIRVRRKAVELKEVKDIVNRGRV